MKLLMIRHGEPCYPAVKELGVVSYLAPLSPRGVAQAEAVAKDERLRDADLIVSSPYTRALQTAAIISRETGIHLVVEPAFHEFLLDTTHQFTLEEEYTRASYREFVDKKGRRDPYTVYHWEPLSHLKERAYPAMQRYLQYDKVIVAAHSVLIRVFGYSKNDYTNCEIFERDFDGNSRCENVVLWDPEKKKKE